MLSLAGPYLAVSALLALGGLLKVIQPAETGNALKALKLPSHLGLVRAIGAGELLIGSAAVLSAGPWWSGLTAAAYLAFAIFVGAARSSGTPLQSCGCFGKAETPPSIIHIVVNLTAASIAGVVAYRPIPAFIELLGDQPGKGIPMLLLIGVMIYLLYLALTALPKALGAS